MIQKHDMKEAWKNSPIKCDNDKVVRAKLGPLKVSASGVSSPNIEDEQEYFNLFLKEASKNMFDDDSDNQQNLNQDITEESSTFESVAHKAAVSSDNDHTEELVLSESTFVTSPPKEAEAGIVNLAWIKEMLRKDRDHAEFFEHIKEIDAELSNETPQAFGTYYGVARPLDTEVEERVMSELLNTLHIPTAKAQELFYKSHQELTAMGFFS